VLNPEGDSEMSIGNIAIIGAGPYGLSLGAYLRKEDIPVEIFGRPMASWRYRMPRGMFLRSEPFASNLWDPEGTYTLKNYYRSCGAEYKPVGMPLCLSDFLDYADWFQTQTVPKIQDRILVRLRRAAGRFDLSFADGGNIRANTVVIATGILPHARIPSILSELPNELRLHTADICELDQFAGREIAVLGAGQSALETAALLHEQGARVQILARATDIVWNHPSRVSASTLQRILRPEAGIGIGWRAWACSELPQVFHLLPGHTRMRAGAPWGPRGADWLRARIIGKVPVLTAHQVIRAEEHDGRVRLGICSPHESFELEVDQVIAGTGYKIDIARLAFLDPSIESAIEVLDGAPKLSSYFESSVAGLYFIGAAAELAFGPAMRFMYGAKHSAAVLAQRFRHRTTMKSERQRGIRANRAVPRSARSLRPY
jgi:hypothetical protein